jgi:hypothetical protein
MTLALGNPAAVVSAAQLQQIQNDLQISRWLTAAPVVDVTRTSLNAGGDNVDQIMASFVVEPAALSGIKVGSMVEVFGLFDVTSSANTKSLRINYTAGAVGPVTMSAVSPTTNISNGIRFTVHIQDLNTIICLAVASASGAGAAATATFTQNSPNVLTTGFTVTLVGRWNSGSVAGSETIVLKHAKALLTL